MPVELPKTKGEYDRLLRAAWAETRKARHAAQSIVAATSRAVASAVELANAADEKLVALMAVDRAKLPD